MTFRVEEERYEGHAAISVAGPAGRHAGGRCGWPGGCRVGADPGRDRLPVARRGELGHPEHAALIARVLAIQPRKPSRKTVAWLAEDEADALLAAPDPATWTGRRDRLLMLLMLTGGPRVSEITALTWDDLSLARPGAHVLWHGKGRKERLTPLQAPAITGLRQWQRENPPSPAASCSPPAAPPGR